MDTMDTSYLDMEELFYDIKIKAVDKLAIDFKQQNIDTSEIDKLWIHVDRIEKSKNKEEKLKQITTFLISNSKHYIEGEKTPLNIFSKNCTLIIKKHLQ